MEGAFQEGETQEQEAFDGGEQGGNDDCNSLCETEGSIASGNSTPTCRENASCSTPRAFVSDPDMDEQLAEEEDVSPRVRVSSERERRQKNNRDSKKVLEKLSLQLLDKNGRVMPVQVKYKTSEKKQTRKESVLGKNVGGPMNS